MQSAPFGHVAVASPAQSAPFRESDTPRVRLYVSRRLQSGALVYAAATRFAEASTHTNPRRARFVYTFAPPWKPRPMGSRQARARSSCERALSFWRRTSQPQPPRNPPIGRAPPSCPPPVPMVRLRVRAVLEGPGAPVMSPSCANGAPLPEPPRPHRRTGPVGRSPVTGDAAQITAPERTRRARYADGSAMRSSLARAWPALRR